ncbi:hypothetical protein [Paenibacillus humicola]|nr:hypothetical protein [Paenibacillus humicola]
MKRRTVKAWTIFGSLILLAMFAAFFYWWRIDFPSPLANMAK